MAQLGRLGQMGCLNVRQLRTSRGTSAPQLGTAAASAGAGDQSQHRSLSMRSGLPYTMAAPGGLGLSHISSGCQSRSPRGQGRSCFAYKALGSEAVSMTPLLYQEEAVTDRPAQNQEGVERDPASRPEDGESHI